MTPWGRTQEEEEEGRVEVGRMEKNGETELKMDGAKEKKSKFG